MSSTDLEWAVAVWCLHHGDCGGAWPPLTGMSPSVAVAPAHIAHHHAVTLTLGSVVAEALTLIHRAGAVVEKRGVLLPHPTCVVRVALDQAAAAPRNQLDGSVQGDGREALTPKAALDQDAGDSIVGQSLGSGQVLLTVMNARQLFR